MLWQERFEFVKEEFIKHGWELPDRFHYQYSFHKIDKAFCGIVFKKDEIYCQLNDFGTCVSYSDIENKTPNEIYKIILNCLEDQLSDYMSKYETKLKIQHDFILAQIKES